MRAVLAIVICLSLGHGFAQSSADGVTKIEGEVMSVVRDRLRIKFPPDSRVLPGDRGIVWFQLRDPGRAIVRVAQIRIVAIERDLVDAEVLERSNLALQRGQRVALDVPCVGDVAITSVPASPVIELRRPDRHEVRAEPKSVPCGLYRLRLTHDGYVPWEADVRIGFRAVAKVAATMERIVLGRLAVDSDPAAADVYLDTLRLGQTPLRRDVPPGTYRLRVEKPPRIPYEDRVTVSEGAVIERRIVLEECLGTLTVLTEPAGASVTVARSAGEQLRQVPPEFPALPCGQYRVSVTYPGYQPRDLVVNISPKQPTVVDVALVRGVCRGTLDVKTDPLGSSVTVFSPTGVRIERRSPASFPDLLCANYRVFVSEGPTHGPYATSVQIVGEGTKQLEIVLPPRQADGDHKATLAVTASGDAVIGLGAGLLKALVLRKHQFAFAVDGETPLGWGLLGVLDGEIAVPPGPHSVRLLFREWFVFGPPPTKKYSLWEKDVDLKAGQRLKIDFDLVNRQVLVDGRAEHLRELSDTSVSIE
jgi:hypothetical protein